MHRYAVFYSHPAWPTSLILTLEAESQEAAEQEAQRRLDDREPLGSTGRGTERVPWQPGIRLVGVLEYGEREREPRTG